MVKRNSSACTYHNDALIELKNNPHTRIRKSQKQHIDVFYMLIEKGRERKINCVVKETF